MCTSQGMNIQYAMPSGHQLFGVVTLKQKDVFWIKLKGQKQSTKFNWKEIDW